MTQARFAGRGRNSGRAGRGPGNGRRWWGGGRIDRNDCDRKLVPGSNPQNLDTFFLANLANFHVATILANLYIYKPNI